MENLTQNETNRLIAKAAKSAGNSWLLTPDQVADLVQDIWVEYLERPTRQRAIDGVTDAEAVAYLRRHAAQILSGQVRAEYLANGDWAYSSESIKAALKGAGDNPFLAEIVPLAVARLADRHQPYAEALKSRYIDGAVPTQGAAAVRLTAAHQALAEEIHSVMVDYDHADGPGSRARVFPDSIRTHNGPGDPVGELAAAMADDAVVRELFDEEAWDEGFAFGQQYVRSGVGRAVPSASIFDGAFNGMAGIAMYRSWVTPELYAGQPNALLQNWSQEELEMYVGGEYVRR